MKYVVSRQSPETSDNLRLNSVKKKIPVELIGPSVSKAKGWNVCEGVSDAYFANFLAAPDFSAAPPGDWQQRIAPINAHIVCCMQLGTNRSLI